MKAKIPSSIYTPVDTEGAGVSVGETVKETKAQSENRWKSAAQNLQVAKWQKLDIKPNMIKVGSTRMFK